jgi:hypothetical protein
MCFANTTHSPSANDCRGVDMLRSLLAATILLLASQLAAAQSVPALGTIKGVGSQTCGTLAGKAPQDSFPMAAVDWVSGYLSARSVSSGKTDDQRFKTGWNEIKTAEIQVALSAFCQRFPARKLEEAAFDLYRQLGGTYWSRF